MQDKEDYFPRGGVVKRKRVHAEAAGTKSDSKDLFQVKQHEPEEKKKKKTVFQWDKREKKKKTIEGKVDIKSHQKFLEVETLSNKNICVDMVTLACVIEVQEYRIMVGLPGGLKAAIPITNISNSYRDLLKLLAEGVEIDTELEVCTLQDLYKVGTIMRCRVMEVTVNKSQSRRITLSINPCDVNRDLKPSSVQADMVVSGAISSSEDHGYIIDLGLKDVQGFLRNNDAEKYCKLYNSGKPLSVGHVVACQILQDIEAGQSRTVNLTIDPIKISKLEGNYKNKVQFNSLLPGMKVSANITQVAKNGLLVQVCGFKQVKGNIHQHHCSQLLAAYTKETEIKAMILWIDTESKVVALTLLPHLLSQRAPLTELFGDIKIFDIIEKAESLSMHETGGLCLKLAPKIRGRTKFKELKDISGNKAREVYQPGTLHQCRVMYLDFIENVAQVSLRKNIIEQVYKSTGSINPGDKIECKVKEVVKGGMRVTIGHNLSGFISHLHLADVPLQHPEKKFTRGDALKCRVLRVERAKSRVMLTNKRSLVTSKLLCLNSYDQAEVGLTYEGFIVQIKDGGVLVAFYNEVKGWVPKTELSSEIISSPERVFYNGQVVKCRVIRCSPDEERMTLSFKMEGWKSFGSRVNDNAPEFDVGKIMECRVQKKTDKGLDVKLLPSGKTAFLPKMHLSDSIKNCDHLLMEVYQDGDIIKGVMCCSQGNTLMLTKKPSHVKASEEGGLPKEFTEIEQGMMVPGTVISVLDFGVFIELPGNLVGLAPNKFIHQHAIKDATSLLKIGQSVIAKVIQVKEEKKRFLLSLRMKDCFHDNVDACIDTLEAYLNEIKLINESRMMKSEKKEHFLAVEEGSVVTVTVSEVNKHGVICHLTSGIKGFATYEHIEGDRQVVVGDQIEAVILLVDPIAECVEVNMRSEIVKAFKRRKKNVLSMARVSQVIKAEVQLVRDDYFLVSLRKHTSGSLAYVPSRKHLNDFTGGSNMEVGHVMPVVIKRIVNGQTLAILKSYLPKVDKETTLRDISLIHNRHHNLNLGQIVTAEIKSVHATQINVDLNGIPAHVHITEVLDNISEGTKPFLSYKPGMKVQVKIIGFRAHNSYNYLPITHRRFKRAIPECTMKPSKLANDAQVDSDQLRSVAPHVGDKVIGFVQQFNFPYMWMQVSPVNQGGVHFLNLSDNLRLLEKPEKHFQPMQGYTCTVLSVAEGGGLDLSLTGEGNDVKQGAVCKAYVQNVNDTRGIMLTLTKGYKGSVSLTDIYDIYVDRPVTKFHIGQGVKCAVIQGSEKAKSKCVFSLRKSLIKEEAIEGDRCIQNYSDLHSGDILRGYVTACNNTGVEVTIGRKVSAYVRYEHVSNSILKRPKDVFFLGKVVTVKVLSVAAERKELEMSMLESDTKVNLHIPKDMLGRKRRKKDSQTQSSESDEDIPNDEGMKKSPIEEEPCAKKPKLRQINKCQETSNLEDTSSEENLLNKKTMERKRKSQMQEEGNVKKTMLKLNIECKVPEKTSSREHERLDMSDENKPHAVAIKGKTKLKRREDPSVKEVKLFKQRNNPKVPDEISTSKVKRKTLESKLLPKKASNSKEINCEAHDSGVELAQDSDDVVSPASISQVEPKAKTLEISAGFSWNDTFQFPTKSGKDESSDDSDDEHTERMRKKTKEERKKERREEDKRLSELERLRLDGATSLQTAEDYDRLVLQSPDSSLVWLRYMAFHLESTEIDKARSVAERALKTISFREEQEKRNVWVALLNLENMFGTSESLKSIFDRALKQNDPLEIYKQLISIYIKSEKTQDAEALYIVMVKKFSQNRNVWQNYAQFCFVDARMESGRKLLQRALKSLPRRDHVDTIAKFAQLEFRFGEPERGKTMFENVLSNYPKRTDLWSIYIDMAVKLGDHDASRQIFERVIHLKMSAKKMKFFFKKYLDFEKKHGDESKIEAIKQKAMDYVDGQSIE